MIDFQQEFEQEWAVINATYASNEPFPDYIVAYAEKIKNFMLPENRKYQGALGNAKGMINAVKEYADRCEITNTAKFIENISLIFRFLLKVRSTSQVPLNTIYFIQQRLKKLDPTSTDIVMYKAVLKKECDFHITNYNAAREKIAQAMAVRIVDRCEEYGRKKIVIGTHCHSGAVIQAILKSRDYIDYVIVSKTEPEQQGILTAKDLCKAGMPVKLINLEQDGTEFRKVSMFLFGVDAVSVEGTVLNKAGTRMIATLARTKELPVYFLGETYKYARDTLFGGLVKIERRDVEQQLLFNHLGVDLSEYARQGLLKTEFSAFDTTKHELYDSIVTEQGFLPMREAFEREWRDYL